MTGTRREPILEALRRTASEQIAGGQHDAVILRGLWKTEYVLRLTDLETTFHLRYIVAQTLGQGCSYYPVESEDPLLDPRWLGTNVLRERFISRALTIATLDAVFASLSSPLPARAFALHGSNIDKSHARAAIVCDEATTLLSTRRPRYGSAFRLVMVGVVGSFVYRLRSAGSYELALTDYDPELLGRSVHGIRVQNGSATIGLVEQADLAIVTGMTLATDTLDAILDTARERGTPVVVFAQTGANFAAAYCDMGVDVVVSEPLPFYLTGSGPSQIRVYRRDR